MNGKNCHLKYYVFVNIEHAALVPIVSLHCAHIFANWKHGGLSLNGIPQIPKQDSSDTQAKVSSDGL